MKITITTDEKLRIRYAAQLLSAITLMDDAVSMTEESANDLVERQSSPSRQVVGRGIEGTWETTAGFRKRP